MLKKKELIKIFFVVDNKILVIYLSLLNIYIFLVMNVYDYGILKKMEIILLF